MTNGKTLSRLILFLLCALFLCGCGVQVDGLATAGANPPATAAALEPSAAPSDSADASKAPDNPQIANAASRVLVVWFSATGTTERIALQIADTLNADAYAIVPETPYTNDDLNYSDSMSRTTNEQNDISARPAIAGTPPDMTPYDAIFLGYPIWFGQAPRIISTFLECCDLSGKTVVPFCTSASSGIGTSASNLHALAADADWAEGRRFGANTSDEEIALWLNDIIDLGEQQMTKNDTLVTNGGATVPLSSLQYCTDNESAPAVYYIAGIAPEALMQLYAALGWKPTGNVAIKLSTGEPPASNYLSPDLIKDLVQSVNGTIVECNTAYGGSRASTAMHMQVAEDHGFTAIADVDIQDREGSMSLPVNGGVRLTENFVGSHFINYDSYLVLSHFKGHAMAGFGGAIKNISIGLGSSEGKSWIHSGGTSMTNPWSGEQDAFCESMAEAGKSVSDYLGNGTRIAYINVMNRLSIDCDCDGNPAEPDIHDIGILASTNPVALDQACVDLIYVSEGRESLVNRIESRNGLHTLEHAEAIGLGSRQYRLVDLDA